jgi:hypothetical protein
MEPTPPAAPLTSKDPPLLTLANAKSIEQQFPGGNARQRQRSGFGKADRFRLASDKPLVHGLIFRV